MSFFLHKIQQKILLHTKDNTIRNRYIFMRLSCMLIIALLFIWAPADKVFAASGLKIYNYTTKKTVTYMEKQIKVTYNGKQISKNSTPGILENGIALVSYKDIFANSPINAICVYDKSKGTVSISKSGITIVMKINSKTAHVNGKAVTMPVAPVKIKYLSDDVTKILVPSRFVCETLGYSYTWNSSNSTVAIEKKDEGLPLSYDDGEKFYYTGTLGRIIIDGEIISLGNMPSIINNNTAMLRAKRAFADSAIGADYKFDKKTNTLTLTKDSISLVMKIGSKTAYVNGKAKTLDRAPMIIYNYDAKASFVMVPGNNTANLLGFDYTWNKAEYTSIITTSKKNDNTNKEPELGDSGIDNTGLILNEWKADESLLGVSTGVHQLNKDETLGTDGLVYNVSREYMDVKPNAETYSITATTPFGPISSSTSGKVINITTNKPSYDYTYPIYGSSGNYVNEIRTIYKPGDVNSYVELTVIPEYFTYDLSLSPDHMTLYVTIYTNSLKTVTLGTNERGDYITLTGSGPLNAKINKQDGLLYVDLPNTTNGIGDQNTVITGGKYLNLIYSLSSPDKTQLLFGLNDGCEFYTVKEGNQYTITLQDSANAQPGTPNEPEDPAIIEPSKYEIIIPKPAGVTRKQLSDKDDYYNNRFYISIPGDYTNYLKSQKITNTSSVVKDISIFLNSNNETVIQVTTSKLQGYEYVTDDNYIYINVGNPRDIYPNIVVLDPGHGGPANGAEYFNTKEKNLNLKILYEIGQKYFNSNPSRLKVYYTRESDVDMTLKDRAAYAQKMGADLFVSLHMNASTASAAYGTEVYYSNNNNSPNKAGLTSKKLAEMFVKNLTTSLGTYNRGAKSEAYTVVHRNTVPAVLIELGFLSNKNDFSKLSNAEFQENAVRIIYETLLDVFKQYPTGR